jgi:hypothetical protein
MFGNSHRGLLAFLNTTVVSKASHRTLKGSFGDLFLDARADVPNRRSRRSTRAGLGTVAPTRQKGPPGASGVTPG